MHDIALDLLILLAGIWLVAVTLPSTATTNSSPELACRPQ